MIQAGATEASVGAIIGGILAGIIFIVVFVFLAVWCSVRTKQRKDIIIIWGCLVLCKDQTT